MTTKQENKGKIKNTEIELYVINKVKEYRIAAKMSQRKLCMELRLSPTYVFYAESPKYTVKYNLNQLNLLKFSNVRLLILCLLLTWKRILLKNTWIYIPK